VCAQRVPFFGELLQGGHGHVGGVEERQAGGLAAIAGAGDTAVARLTHDGGDGDASLTRHRDDAPMALVVEKDLQPMLKHEHAVQLAVGACRGTQA